MNVLVCSTMLIPAACLAIEASASDSRTPVVDADSGWLAQTNFSGVPAGMPAPHSLGAVPAVWQVVWPLGTTFQPWALSSETAVDGL